MSEYQFKVGDRGKTRDGRDYRVIADDVRCDDPLAVAVTDDYTRREVVEGYQRDGSFSEAARGSAWDLMPPPAPPTRKIKRWLVARSGIATASEAVTVFGPNQGAEYFASRPDSLMPDGKPHEVELDILERRENDQD
jgi:hypothetical protein